MIKKLCNLYIKHKTKGLTQIPLFTVTFDYQKFKQYGKEESCIIHLHPDIVNDEFVKEKLRDCVDYIRDNYDMDIFTRI